jgi:hypothetical protein
MKIALVAQHTTPLDRSDARQYPERARLRQLTRCLAGHGHHVTLYSEKTGPDLPDRAELGDGVRIEHIGPVCPGTADEHGLLARVPAFSGTLRDRLRHDRPDIVDAVRWTSGLGGLAAARGLDIPVVQ